MSAVVLTGGIATGKTTVTRILEAHAIAVLDTDGVAAQLSGRGGRAITALQEAFGEDCLSADGGLDRPRMRDLVFADPAARARLEAILHPMIRQEVDAFLDANEAQPCVVAIPLYFETLGYRGRFHRVVAVDCSESLQRSRLVRERGMAMELATAILKSQVPRMIRLQLADSVLCNNAGLDALESQVAEWVRTWP